MKIKLLFLFLIVCIAKSNSQCQGPPPPAGIDYVYALDTDNDGYATFDMDYYITYVERPRLENIYGISSSGYNFTFQAIFGPVLPLQYTNVTANENHYVVANYSGSGPTFQPQPPCYWPLYLAINVFLIPVPSDLDMDQDGITNADEDTNNNLNLMDDDDDNDGEINLKDAVNNLSLTDVRNISLTVYPNPVANGILTFESNVLISAVSIYDLSGKMVAQPEIQSKTVNIDTLANGIYLVKFVSENGLTYSKIAIQR